MNKVPNNKAWWLVLPVLLLVAFNAVIPLMTVVNYSVQETFGDNRFFFEGVKWYDDVVNSGRFHEALKRQLLFTGIVLALLSSYMFTRAIPLYFVGTLVTKSVMLDLGPVLTGMALAGVYPVAMKVLAGWFRRGRGLAIGIMIGALTLGSALPYLFRALGTGDKTLPILYRNVYGWYVRLDRGTYDIRDEGRAALAAYPDLVAWWEAKVERAEAG